MCDEEFKKSLREAISDIDKLKKEIGKRIIGQRPLVNGMIMGLLGNGHVLLEGVPGLAKTFAVKTLAEVLDLEFRRLQFTPDLLPADLIGSMIYRKQTEEFVPRKGPIFSSIILADEINRAPARVQSALLEAMEERQVTIGEHTFPLPTPFIVFATQNPIEHEGTYPLPEAQIDRFSLKLKVDYPSMEEELMILKRLGIEKEIPVCKVMDIQKIENLKRIISEIKVDSRIEEYIVSIVLETRKKGNSYLEFGASPRGSIYLLRYSRINALMQGRSFVLPEDVKDTAADVLRHRLVLSYEAEAEGLTPDDIVREVLSAVKVP